MLLIINYKEKNVIIINNNRLYNIEKMIIAGLSSSL